ncbi:MAG: mechanosensitive ion channel family protein [Myxococcota bacterium]
MEWFEHIGIGGGLGILVALAMIIVLPLVLPAGQRRCIRSPVILLILHGAMVAARALLGGDAEPLRIAGLFFLLSSMARSGYLILLHAVAMRTLGGDVPRIVRDLIQAVIYVGVVLVTLRSAGVEPGSLLTTSALLTAVIGLSLQDTLGNLFAGLAIQAQRPFRVGDWIQFDEEERHIGRVVELNWRTVKVVTLDLVEMTVPNATLARSALRNYSMPTSLARQRAYVVAPYDSSPERVMPRLESAIGEVPGVLRDPAPSVIIEDFSERGVRYEVRYFIETFEEREVIAGQVRERLWYALQRMGIEIPAPQRHVRMFDLTEERLEHQEEARVHERDEALQSVDFLRALPESARGRLAEAARTGLYAPGELIIRRGEAGTELFIINRGEVTVELGTPEKPKVVARLGAGQFFGEMSLITGERRTASVRAAKESELLMIDKRALQVVLDEAPELAETISRVLAERAQQLADADVKVSEHDVKRTVEQETTVLLDRIRRFFSLR